MHSLAAAHARQKACRTACRSIEEGCPIIIRSSSLGKQMPQTSVRRVYIKEQKLYFAASARQHRHFQQRIYSLFDVPSSASETGKKTEQIPEKVKAPKEKSPEIQQSEQKLYSLFEKPRAPEEPPKENDEEGTRLEQKIKAANVQQLRNEGESTTTEEGTRSEQIMKAANALNVDTKPSLEGISQKVDELNLYSSSLKPSTLPVVDVMAYDDNLERQALFIAAKEILTALESAVQRRYINPSGRQGREVSAILGNIMKLFSATYFDGAQSAFLECSKVLSFLDTWNLSRQGPHYHYAILAAVHEQRWKQASDLFMQQVDASAPLDISISSPIGFYAMARAAQENETTVVEPVMSAVVNLSLFSPTEQEKYILAAGTALGLAGEWESLVAYLQNSYNAGDLGQPLVAAAMHACILSNQHDEALRVFRTLQDGTLVISSEFHWGGGQYQIQPLCRDLAMRALGKSVYGGTSTQALEFLRQTLDDELAVSDEALLGVLLACEQDHNWQGAIEILFLLLDDNSRNLWIVPGSELSVPDISDLAQTDNSGAIRTTRLDTGKVLSSLLMACNRSQQFGLAMVCYLFVDAAPPGSLLSRRHATSQKSENQGLDQCGSIEQTLLPILAEADNSPELLSATMTSLCGLGCYEEASLLFGITAGQRNDSVGMQQSGTLDDAEHICHFAQHQLESSPYQQRRWDSAHRHIHRIAKTLKAIKYSEEVLTSDQLQILSSALAAALRSCTFANQPNSGIIVAEYAKNELFKLSPTSGEISAIFGGSSAAGPANGLLINDTLLAEQMKAYQAVDQSDTAIALFQFFVDSANLDAVAAWSQSCNVALSILAQNDGLTEAMVLFRQLVKASGNMDSFDIAGQILADAERWTDVGDVYHMALGKGCLSEKLGLLALKAVVEMQMPGKLRALRGIIGDTAQAVGTNSTSWLENHYRDINYMLGFSHTRLLMWWNDPRTSHVDELQFAIDVFEKRLQDGLRPKHAAVKVIVSHARRFNDGHFPNDKKAVARVPRNRDSWVNLLRRVLDESQSLRNDTRFIDEATIALRHLECYRECVDFVEQALHRGVRVNQIALEEALLAADALGLKRAISAFRLMLVG